MTHSLFATCPKGLELLLVDELRELGAATAREKLAGVEFTGSLEAAYRACLWSRLANRILLKLTSAPAASPEALYAVIKQVNWSDHLSVQNTFAVHATCSQSIINHTLFAAQKIKDAIVDQFRDKVGKRPNVDRERADVSIYVHLQRDVATVYLDLSGKSLHKRGYRLDTGAAPLKENLAAAILLRAGWPAIAKEKGALMDPMCGSGTLLIEGALMAADIAPGLDREYFGFLGWKHHDAALWRRLRQEAEQRRTAGVASLPVIVGYDRNPEAIKIAFANIERAGMRGKIHVEKHELATFTPSAKATTGLVVVNPPYGERLGEIEELQPLYTELGTKLKESFVGWKAAVFTGNPDLGKQMGLRSKHQYVLFNGAIACKLLIFKVEETFFIDRSESAENRRRIYAAQKATADSDMSKVQMFVNRVSKNIKHLKPKMAREGITTYRIYDADLPEYAFALDLQPNGAHLQEYQAPSHVDEHKILRRRQEVLSVLPELLNLDATQIFYSSIPRK